ncbi:MAG TPA: hypothetical protein PLR26_02620 [Bacilli bacterium]|nr:hypothetical protein [Bacilli bacterium]
MIQIIKMKLKEKKYVLEFSIMLALFLLIYFVIDQLSGGYQILVEDYGWYLVIMNIGLNIIMATTSAFMMILSTYHMSQTKKEAKGAYVSFFSIIFGIFTYGCTPCVVAGLSIIGITFSVAVLPLAGLPYKFISLVLLLIGFAWLRHELNHPKCKITIEPKSHEQS